MTNYKTKSRRKLLKSLVAGGGSAVVARSIPEQWSRPVVDVALIPAHAATTMISCSVAMSLRLNTNQADWDLGVSFQGSQLTGKGGAIAGLVHGGDATPPGVGAAPVDLRETVAGTLQVPGSYRVFARLAAVIGDTSDSESGVGGSITTCSGTFAIATDLPDTPPGGDVTLATVTLAADGTAAIS